MSQHPTFMPGAMLELQEIPTLDALHKLAVDAAMRAQNDKGEAPFAWHLSSGKQLVVILTSWIDDREKYGVVRALRDLLEATPSIQRYSFSGEAWVASYDQEQRKGKRYVQPKDREDRREVLMVFSFDRNGERRADVYQMDRDKDGKIIRKRDDAFDHYDSMAGAMWDLFRPERR